MCIYIYMYVCARSHVHDVNFTFNSFFSSFFLTLDILLNDADRFLIGERELNEFESTLYSSKVFKNELDTRTHS